MVPLEAGKAAARNEMTTADTFCVVLVLELELPRARFREDDVAATTLVIFTVAYAGKEGNMGFKQPTRSGHLLRGLQW